MQLTEQQIRKRILNCTRCDLSSRAGVKPVPWHGPVPADIAICGEAPGLQENIQGRPFVEAGASGRLLRGELLKHGIDPDECCILNTVSCFPAEQPPIRSQNSCRLHLRRQLGLAEPKIILVLGAVALNFFDPDLRITKCHGKNWLTRWGLVFATVHPAAALRDPEKRIWFGEDIASFTELVSKELQ